MNELQRLCEIVEKTEYDSIRAEVVEYCNLLIADHYISAIAGYTYNKEFNMLLESYVLSNYKNGNCSVLFSDNRLVSSGAAMINAAYCHGADIDDGHRESEAHPGVAVIASVLALAEEIGASGKEVDLAIILGYEVFIRIAKSILPSHLKRGFHTTGTVGTLAAAAACSKLLGLNAKQIENAISLASTQTAGLLIVCESGQATKPINPGKAAQTAIMCARMASQNVDAPREVFDSKKGFTHAFTDEYRSFCLTDNLDNIDLIMDTYVKLYPSCRHTHATIEALKKCIRENGSIAEADKIEIYTYPIAVDIVGHNIEPHTIGDVKFSIPYTAACVAMNGSYSLCDLADFENNREAVINYAKKIVVIADEKYDDIPNGIRGAEVCVKMPDGIEYSSSVSIARGEGEDRIDWTELREKASACCQNVESSRLDDLIDFCKNLDNMECFNQFNITVD